MGVSVENIEGRDRVGANAMQILHGVWRKLVHGVYYGNWS